MDLFNLYEEMNKIDDEASLNVNRKSLNEGMFDMMKLRKKLPPEVRRAQIVQMQDVAPRGRRRTYYMFADPETNIHFGPESKTRQELKDWLETATPEEIKSTYVKYSVVDMSLGNELDDIMISEDADMHVNHSIKPRRSKKLFEDDNDQEADATTDGEQAAEGSSDVENIIRQLGDADYETFVKILNSDGKSQAFLSYLKQHYKTGDDAIGTIKKAAPVVKTLPCKRLIPTQRNISVTKSLDVIEKPGWSIDIINTPESAFTTPTVTYGGKYIIDGHHRWSRIVALDGPDTTLTVLDFPEIEGVNWEEMLKAVQLSIVATVPNPKLIQKVPNDNLLSASGAKQAMQFYYDNACAEVVAAMKEKGRGENKEEQAKTVGKNIANTMKTSKPVQGAAKRDFMPQMDDDGRAEAKLRKVGVIDLNTEE